MTFPLELYFSSDVRPSSLYFTLSSVPTGKAEAPRYATNVNCTSDARAMNSASFQKLATGVNGTDGQ